MPMKRLFVFFFFLIVAWTTTPILSRSETPEVVNDAAIALSNLAFPEEIGKVRERFVGKNPRTIIQIQDVHAHATAQQNIASILERLRTVFGMEKVALEGAWTSTSLPESHAIPTSREKQLLAGSLLEKGRISGPVCAAIMSPEPITLVGIEEKASYEKNRALFLDHLTKTEETRGKLQTYGALLGESQRSTWGPELLSLGNAFEKFRDTSDLGKFFPVLLRTAEARNADISDLPQIVLLKDITALEKSFEKARLEKEVKQVLKKYKDRPWTIEELIRGGKIPPQEIGLYPEIKKLTLLYKMRDELSLLDLTDQIETLTGRTLEKLVRTSEESALWEKTERFYLARRILLLQASPADIKTYKRENLVLRSELSGAGLSEALSLSLGFYEVVQKRDEIFFEKIVSDPSLTGNIALVTGGFHTEGLSQRLRDAGISYITITPELGGVAMNEKLYNERMTEAVETEKIGGIKSEMPSGIRHSPPSPEEVTLSDLRNAIAWIDNSFQKSYAVLMQTRDVRKAEEVFWGNAVAVPRSDRIAHLSRERKVVSKPEAGVEVSASELRVNEFAAKPRREQIQTVQDWLAQGPEKREKAMLVSSVSILAKMLREKTTVRLLEEAINNGAIVSLAQDVPATEMPEALFSIREIDRFEAPDIAMMIEKTPRFQRLAKKHPFAIMKDGHPGGAYVVLPEKPLSLVLFRIITLNPSLYQAAKNPAFLTLLEDLVAEILSQEFSKKSA